MGSYSTRDWLEAVEVLAVAYNDDRDPFRQQATVDRLLFNLCHRSTKRERDALVRELQRVDAVEVVDANQSEVQAGTVTRDLQNGGSLSHAERLQTEDHAEAQPA